MTLFRVSFDYTPQLLFPAGLLCTWMPLDRSFKERQDGRSCWVY